MAPTEEQVRSALRTVEDPTLGLDVIEAQIVERIDVSGATVETTVDCAGLDPATGETVVDRIRGAIFEVPGVEHVAVDRSSAAPAGHNHSGGEGGVAPGENRPPSTTPDRADDALPETVIAVGSAKGGVGKTTVAVGLARSLADAGRTVGVFDADLYGPNLPSVLDVDRPLRADEEGRVVPVEADGLRTVSAGFLTEGSPLAWRGAMAHEAVDDLLFDTDWDDCDVLVIDLPPGTGDVVLTLLQEAPVDRSVLVTTPYPTAVEDTARSVELFEDSSVPVTGAVVNMAGFTCPDCGSVHDLFGDDEVSLDVPILASVPFDPEVRERDASTDYLEPVADALRDRSVPSERVGGIDARGDDWSS